MNGWLYTLGAVSLVLGALVYRGMRTALRELDERTITEHKSAAWSDAPAEAEQRLREAIGSGRR